MMRYRLMLTVAAVVAAALLISGCGSLGNQFLGNPGATPPARPSHPAGQAYAAAARYLAAHPQRTRKGMTYGILVRSSSPGWASQQLNGGAWQGLAVVPGGRIEHLSSDPGDNGMASLASPGDLIAFPAGGPVDAPSDDGDGTPARVILAGAVG